MPQIFFNEIKCVKFKYKISKLFSVCITALTSCGQIQIYSTQSGLYQRDSNYGGHQGQKASYTKQSHVTTLHRSLKKQTTTLIFSVSLNKSQEQKVKLCHYYDCHLCVCVIIHAEIIITISTLWSFFHSFKSRPFWFIKFFSAPGLCCVVGGLFDECVIVRGRKIKGTASF